MVAGVVEPPEPEEELPLDELLPDELLEPLPEDEPLDALATDAEKTTVSDALPLAAVCTSAGVTPLNPLDATPPAGSAAAQDAGVKVAVPSAAIPTWKFHGPLWNTSCAVAASGNFKIACQPPAPAGKLPEDRFLTDTVPL